MINKVQPFSQTQNSGARFNPSFQALEQTVVILKPDAKERKLDGAIKQALKTNIQDYRVIDSWKGIIPEEKLVFHYDNISKRPYFPKVISYMRSGPSEIMVVQGDDAIKNVRRLGAKIRKMFVPEGEKERNLIHTSDGKRSAKREIKNFQPLFDRRA